MKKELELLILDIKSLCNDRLDAITANGKELKEVFEAALELVNKIKKD